MRQIPWCLVQSRLGARDFPAFRLDAQPTTSPPCGQLPRRGESDRPRRAFRQCQTVLPSGFKGSGKAVVYLTMEKLTGLIELSLILSCTPAGNSRRGLLVPDVSTTTLMSSGPNSARADCGPD